VLAQFTEEGIRILKNSLQWAGQGDLGCVIEEICWTPGQYDIVAIVDAKDDQALTTFGLAWGSAGNVRMQTLRAINKSEFGSIIGKLP